jgi:glycosyltransferase involved in cell wall biosynthesis
MMRTGRSSETSEPFCIPTRRSRNKKLNRRRIGIVTDGLIERRVGNEIRIANGGVGVYIYQLVRCLLEDQNATEYYLIRFGKGELDIYRHPRAHFVSLPIHPWKPVEIAFDLPYARLVRELGLDLLHFPNQFGGGFLPRSIRRVATLHDLTPVLLPRTHPLLRVAAYRMLARISLRKCDRVIVPSRATRHDVVEMGYADSSRVAVIPMGLSDSFQPSAQTSEFTKTYNLTRPFILNVGVLEPRKNQLLLFEVLRRIRETGVDIELVIIGREGWRWENPLERAEFESLRSHIRIFTDVPEAALVEFYGRASAFVYPSIYEGFGLPIIEAMACGTPVVASNNSSLPELGQQAALYADARDAGSFVMQVKRVLDDDALRQRMIAAGKERARQFSWRGTMKLTAELYESVCEQSTQAVPL